MKIIKNSLWFFGIMLTISSFTSCNDDENLSGPATVSNLIAYPGRNRAKLEFTATDDATHGRIFYGKGDFYDFSIDRNDLNQSIMLEGLSEQEHIIRVVTFNNDSITSDPKGVKVKIFGEKYQGGLSNRTLNSQSTLSPTSINMMFGNAKEDEVEVRVIYQNTSGQKDSSIVHREQNAITIEDIDLSESYYYYTVYSPVQESIDYFFTKNVDAKIAAMQNFEKENWKIDDFSDEDPGIDGIWGLSTNIIDNDAKTSWHSMKDEMPHFISVDMQSSKLINGFYFVQTQDLNVNVLARKFKFETSIDNQNWTVAKEGNIANDRFRQIFEFAGQVEARYFRITILDNYEGVGYAHIAEIDLFNDENVSGENGPREIPLVNAKEPFEGDGSDLFPAVGAGRMQQIQGWTHNENAYISYDNGKFTLWSSAVWGIADVRNGKIYQTLELQPGNYTLNIDAGHTTNDLCADVYGLIAIGENLPDFSNVTSSQSVLGVSDLVANKESINAISFTIETSTLISIGIVYNTHSIFETLGIPWSDFIIKGFSLALNP
jgi:hypothetical protein